MVRILSVRASDWCSSCEAPPGYAKMTSTPSRMRHSTTASDPFISRPISGWGNAAGEVVVFMGIWVEKIGQKNGPVGMWQACGLHLNREREGPGARERRT